jgi:hypothetical protein
VIDFPLLKKVGMRGIFEVTAAPSNSKNLSLPLSFSKRGIGCGRAGA